MRAINVKYAPKTLWGGYAGYLKIPISDCGRPHGIHNERCGISHGLAKVARLHCSFVRLADDRRFRTQKIRGQATLQDFCAASLHARFREWR